MTVLTKSLLPLFITLFSIGLYAQKPTERLTGLSAMPIDNIEQAQKKTSVVSLPFIDEFSYQGPFPNPNLWVDNHVYINQTLALSPITIGVATFDGLNEFGKAYQLGNNNTRAVDTLTSQIIDLSNPIDSVFISFYYQAGGNGEIPSRDDSLALHFWSETDTAWLHAWSVTGGWATDFKQVLVYIDSSFYSPNFQFRFMSYGSPAGAFDHWHIDYVILDEERSSADTILNDIAFTRPHPSLLTNFESIPWFHVDNVINLDGLQKDDIRLYYRRNTDPQQPRPSLFLGEFTIEFNGNIVDQNGQADSDLDDAHVDNEESRFPVPDTADAGRPRLDFLNPPYIDEFELISRQYYSGGSQTYSQNDTVIKRQIFKNYYAYDDGSAERAFEVLNNTGGFIVQKYDIFASDTLIGLNVYFLPSYYNVEDNEFSIIVLENNAGIPGQIIFESDSLYEPVFSLQDFYHTYLLDISERNLEIGETVFIGIRQKNADPISLGYDRNRVDVTEAFYGKVDDLYQSFLQGTIMMRPIFRYEPRDLNSQNFETSTVQFELFPNPGNTRVYLNINEDQDYNNFRFDIINISGQKVVSAKAQKELNIEKLQSGLYIFQLHNLSNGQVSQQKLLIR